ncbi:MAG: conjugal transfer protein TraF [Nitrospiria bacterium]
MMNRNPLALYVVFVLMILGLANQSEAREWTIVGPRALGMGGANVAVANDATADYWNPAAFGFFKDSGGGDYGKRDWSWQINAGVGAQIHGDMGQEINDISKFNFSDIQNAINSGTPLTGTQVSNFIQLVNELKLINSEQNQVTSVSADGGLRIQVGHFGIGAYALADLSSVPTLDLVDLSPGNSNLISEFASSTTPFGSASCGSANFFSPSQITSLTNSLSKMPGWSPTSISNYINSTNCALSSAQSSGVSLPTSNTIVTDLTSTAQLASNSQAGNSLSNNTSSLIFRGIAVTEVPITYGRAISEDLSIGGNLKFMQGRAYHSIVPVFNNFSDALNKAEDKYEESQNFGLDLGLLYRLGDKLRFGMVGRNLNGPSFAMPSIVLNGPDDSIRELPEVRAGIAYKPLSFLMFAADVDLTRNDTTMPGESYKSQNVAGGMELNIFKFIQLRGGIYTNLAENDIGPVYTAGLGLNFWLFNLDIGAAMGSKRGQIDDNSIPNEARAEFALSMLF